MTICNLTLKAEGKNYPRTCRKCGLGPCTGKPKNDASTRLKAIAGQMQNLPYRDMQKLAELIGAQPSGSGMAGALLAAADTILAGETPAPGDDDAE